jgi:tetratricopeptide (TPR) repeat protein
VRRLFAFTLCTVVMAATLAVPAQRAAAADEDEAAQKRARKHFKKGEKLFALGRFEEALAEYETAFEEYPAPEILFNIGQCHRNLGHYDEAIFSFRKYLRLLPEAENRDAVEELIAELEEDKRRDDEAQRGNPRVDPIPLGGGRGKDVPADRPVYKKWWFWTGVAVVVGGATAYALTRDGGSLPETDLGNIDFSK